MHNKLCTIEMLTQSCQRSSSHLNVVQLLIFLGIDTSLRFCEGESLLLDPGKLSLELARVIKEDVHQASLQLEHCLRSEQL